MNWLPNCPEEAAQLGKPSLVFQDAGAGNHIRSWMPVWPGAIVHTIDPRTNPGQAGEPTEFTRLRECVDVGDWVLVGTGRSLVSQTAMRLGKSQGKVVLAVVDHWVNYPQRFESLTASCLPDGVVVTDGFALAQVTSELPWATPVLWPNQLAAELEKAVQQHRESERPHLPREILILGEASRGDIEDAERQPEGWLVESLPETLGRLGLRLTDCRIELRLHPNEADNKYEGVVQRLSFPLTVRNPAERDITRAIAQADLVLGLTTYALFLAWLVGKPTWSLAECMGLRSPFPPSTVPQLRIHA